VQRYPVAKISCSISKNGWRRWFRGSERHLSITLIRGTMRSEVRGCKHGPMVIDMEVPTYNPTATTATSTSTSTSSKIFETLFCDDFKVI
jgi:hypothetical protein